MRGMATVVCGLLVCLGTLVLSGCASATVGTPIDKSKVDTIQKGVTTRSQVEAMFGTASNVAVLDDGRRQLTYVYANSDVKCDVDTYIPIWDIFSSHAHGTTYTQTLQVIVRKDSDIVDDYEYSDKTQQIVTSSGILGSGTTATTVPSTQPS
ncbi:MAG: outer membrane protein assembly factor BamE [Tepidisphaeraceae bacterium]